MGRDGPTILVCRECGSAIDVGNRSVYCSRKCMRKAYHRRIGWLKMLEGETSLKMLEEQRAVGAKYIPWFDALVILAENRTRVYRGVAK